jgi:hypothetical protein
MTIIKFHGHLRPDAMEKVAERKTLHTRAMYDACVSDLCRQGRLECPTPTLCRVPTTAIGRILARLRGWL